MACGLTFMNYNLLTPPKFIGLNNFKRLAVDPLFGKVFGNTLKFFLILMPIHCVIALIIAYFVSEIHFKKLQSLFRNIFYFPTIVTTASVAYVWTYMFATDTGFVNYFIRRFGGQNVPWMTDTTMLYVTIALFSFWKFIGTNFLYYLVGIQNIPTTYHEAAMIDGASKRQVFFKITLPLLSPTIFFVVVTEMIGVFQIFDEPYFIASPNNAAARTLALHIYLNAFDNMRIGYASVLALIMLGVILILTVLQFLGQRKWVNYDYE
jgi:multiple sugar transport system permease protein